MATSTAVARPCHSCGVLVYDLIHERTRRSAPIEVEAATDGNISIDLEAGTYRVVGPDMQRRIEVGRHLNHFAVCPAAMSYRGGRIRGR